ncbi:MAG TPA: hypothetical protein VNW47_15400 [Terriglobales bacterium]|jgi:hypothetical protein|nr:hypothetical protein [Terriglobales bacterium]
MSRLSAYLVTVALVCAAVVSAAAAPQNEQLPAGPMQEKAAAACLSCHEARIIVQQRLSKAAWAREMDKMTKWGAPVDPADRDALIDYFSANFSPEQSPYVAPRTSGKPVSKTSAKAKH